MLKDKTILITGSASGIGAATARLAVRYGAKVILHGRTQDERLKAITDELVMPSITCDVSHKSQTEEAIQEAIKNYGPIQGLVNSAGIALSKPFLELTEEDWLSIYGTNVFGTAYVCQALLSHMQEHARGSIVNIASVRGLAHASGILRSTYAASKASIINLTTSLASEFAPSIRINAVAPGFTETNIAKGWSPVIRKLAESCLLQRTAQPEEIGEVVCFLLSDRASFITGQTIIADGGYSIRN